MENINELPFELLCNSFKNMKLFEFHNKKYVMKLHNIIEEHANNIYYKFYIFYKLTTCYDENKLIPNWISYDECKFFNKIINKDE